MTKAPEDKYTASHMAKQAHVVLEEWSRFIRAGNRIRLGGNVSSIYHQATPVNYRTFNEDRIGRVDAIVNAIQNPIRRVGRRYYLDEVKGKRHIYHPLSTRAIEHKAKDEEMSVDIFKGHLKIFRHIVFHKLQEDGVL